MARDSKSVRRVLRRYQITPSQFRVMDFVGWQRDGALELNPAFQRRSVWKPGSRSYFVDTLVRGLPVPLIFIRERIELDTQKIVREIVDGQQRLRTIFAFIDHALVPQYEAGRDDFSIAPEHNPELAGKTFKQLTSDVKNQILGYRFSVQILPSEIEDRDVLQIFARLNSTGIRLNHQELRNAAWFGKCKTTMYDLAYEQLERWLKWVVFSEDQVSRMAEVELVSDLIVNLLGGLAGKSQSKLDAMYAKYDETFPQRAELSRRFRRIMDMIDELYGERIASGAFSRQMHFFTLFVYLYDKAYGLGSDLGARAPHRVAQSISSRLAVADRRLLNGPLPTEMVEAVTGAATDIGKRRTRLKFLAKICDAATG